MAKFRVLKVVNNDLDYIYLIQKKNLFFGWKTIDDRSTIQGSIIYIARINPHYKPKPEEIVLEID